MTRMWRTGAGPLLVGFMLLDVAIFAYTETAGARINAHFDLTAQQTGWTVLDAFLVWRVWRGGRAAWAVLFGLNLIALALLVAGAWSAYASALWAFGIAQIVILLTPAVRHHVRQGQQPEP
jgi:hypothetical protein